MPAMLSKLLVLAAIVAAIVMVVKRRRQLPVAEAAGDSPLRSVFKTLAVLLVVIGMATSIGYGFLHWREDAEPVTLRVIDTRSGQVSTYQARHGDVSERSFRTLAGHQVFLAETERLEVIAD